MIHRFRFRAWPALLFSCAAVFFETAVLAAGQSQTAPPRKDAAPEMPSHAQPADVSGDWKASWRGRLGTEPGTLHFQEDGTKLSGTFKDLHGLSSLRGRSIGTRFLLMSSSRARIPSPRDSLGMAMATRSKAYLRRSALPVGEHIWGTGEKLCIQNIPGRQTALRTSQLRLVNLDRTLALARLPGIDTNDSWRDPTRSHRSPTCGYLFIWHSSPCHLPVTFNPYPRVQSRSFRWGQ